MSNSFKTPALVQEKQKNGKIKDSRTENVSRKINEFNSNFQKIFYDFFKNFLMSEGQSVIQDFSPEVLHQKVWVCLSREKVICILDEARLI